MSEAVIAQKAPYGKEIEAGKTYYWCACGRTATAWLCGCKQSKNAPYCDGSHKSL